MAIRALHHALELAERPSLASLMRQQGLPADVVTLIRIAAGSPETLAEEVDRTGRSSRAIREAAILYVQQVLFFPGADAYRVLGASPAATQEQLAQHMRLLMKWLHPDRDRNDWESAFAERVTGAWDLVKSSDRRARYDLSLSQPDPSSGRKRRLRRAKVLQRLPSVERIPGPEGPSKVTIVIRAAAVLLVVAIALAVLTMPQASRPWLDETMGRAHDSANSLGGSVGVAPIGPDKDSGK